VEFNIISGGEFTMLDSLRRCPWVVSHHREPYPRILPVRSLHSRPDHPVLAFEIIPELSLTPILDMRKRQSN
jgi:hypothetical protein